MTVELSDKICFVRVADRLTVFHMSPFGAFTHILQFIPIENSFRDFDKSCSKSVKNPRTIG